MSRRYWYKYVGPAGGEFTPGNYIFLLGQNPAVVCFGGPSLCAIYAYGGTIPTFLSFNLQSYIGLAKARKHSYPDLFGQLPYVWVEGNP